MAEEAAYPPTEPAQEKDHPKPEPAEGFQRPGIPGAGNIFDPAIRAAIREQLQSAAQKALQALLAGIIARVGAGDAAAPRTPAMAKEEAAAGPDHPVGKPRTPAAAGPIGGLDLSFLQGNVVPPPVQPRRVSAARQFYFLPQPPAEPDQRKLIAPPHPAGLKPG